jgi:hypothetical protein
MSLKSKDKHKKKRLLKKEKFEKITKISKDDVSQASNEDSQNSGKLRSRSFRTRNFFKIGLCMSLKLFTPILFPTIILVLVSLNTNQDLINQYSTHAKLFDKLSSTENKIIQNIGVATEILSAGMQPYESATGGDMAQEVQTELYGLTESII